MPRSGQLAERAARDVKTENPGMPHRGTARVSRIISPEWLRVELVAIALVLAVVVRFDIGAIGSFLRSFFGLLFR